jgi:hypothetical protein
MKQYVRARVYGGVNFTLSGEGASESSRHSIFGAVGSYNTIANTVFSGACVYLVAL